MDLGAVARYRASDCARRRIERADAGADADARARRANATRTSGEDTSDTSGHSGGSTDGGTKDGAAIAEQAEDGSGTTAQRDAACTAQRHQDTTR